MSRLGEAKANVALAHSLLTLVYAMLKEGRPYREPDPGQMHELERAKLVRHHTKRLQQLGADAALIDELVARLDTAPVCSSSEQKQTVTTLPQRILKACAPRVCRGALGFRARQTRKQQYSVFKHPAAETPRGNGLSQHKTNPQKQSHLS